MFLFEIPYDFKFSVYNADTFSNISRYFFFHLDSTKPEII